MALDQDALSALKRSPLSGLTHHPRWQRLSRWRWPFAVLVLLLVFWAKPWGHAPLPVDVVAVSAPPASGRATILNASGYVVARRLATVASKVTGRVVEVNVDEGMQVAEGQVLARLDTATAAASRQVAVAEHAASEKALNEIAVRLQDAKRQLTRNQELLSRHLVAQSVADTSAADVDALTARLQQQQSQVAVATSLVRQRQQDLDDLIIRAPFAGVVITKDAQPGEMVSPISAGGGFTRTGIATLVDMASRELEVDVNEAFIHRVHEGQPVEAVLDAYPEESFAAHVIRVVPTADRQKATVKVRIGLERLEPRILPDMGVKVRFLDVTADAYAHAVGSIPSEALVGDHVWVVVAGRAHTRAVRVAASLGNDVPVLSGLALGDHVILKPSVALTEGATVTKKGE
jgi:RND family efflux transporter MFP subunit